MNYFQNPSEGQTRTPLGSIGSTQLKLGAGCTHTAGTTARFFTEGPHYAELQCSSCGAHISYLPKPATLERRARNAANLSRLLIASPLKVWDREFLSSLSKQAKWSPRQQEVFDKICVTYLKGGAQ
jgi:hypothetical protein